MNEAVVITGIGVVSPFGVSVNELATRVAAGESALAPLPGFNSAYGATVGDIPLEAVPPESRTRIGRLDRLCRLFLSAAHRAVADAQLEIRQIHAERAGLSFGTGLGCLLTNAEYNQKVLHGGPAAASPRLFAYTVSSAAAGEVSIALGIKGANLTAHQGFAAGLGAIGYAYDLIRTGKADVVVAGGADALGDALVQGLADMGLLKREPGAMPFRDVVPGIYPSEGAAVLVLEGAAHARARGARAWARIPGYAAGFEPTLTQRTRESTALVETMRSALGRSGHPPADVNLLVASAHATAVDATERAALATVFHDVLPTVWAPKTAWGECFAAHGALSVALVAALLRGSTSLAAFPGVLDVFKGESASPLSLVRDGSPARPTRPPDPSADTSAGGLRSAGGFGPQAEVSTLRRAPEDGSRVRAGAAHRTDAGRSPRPLAMIHALCYSGPTVALLLAREE